MAKTGEPGLPGVVRTRLFLGSHWMLEVTTDLGVLRASIANTGALPPAEGDSVVVAWSDQDLRMLSTEAAHG